MKSRIIVGAIIEKDGKLLFGKKKKDIGPYPNTLVIIGGGARLETETIEDAIKREIVEEANIKIKNLKRLSFDEDYEPNKYGQMSHLVFLVFKAEYESGKPTPGDDIVELIWLEKKDLSKYQLARPTVKLFKELKWL